MEFQHLCLEKREFEYIQGKKLIIHFERLNLDQKEMTIASKYWEDNGTTKERAPSIANLDSKWMNRTNSLASKLTLTTNKQLIFSISTLL